VLIKQGPEDGDQKKDLGDSKNGTDTFYVLFIQGCGGILSQGSCAGEDFVLGHLVAHIDTGLPLAKKGPDAGKVLESDDISALFGIDITVAQPEKKHKKSHPKVKAGARKKVVSPPPEKSAVKAKTTKKRKRHPAASARRENAVWREVEELVSRRNGSAYDQATTLLLDLRKRSGKGRKTTTFARHLAALRARHERKGKFIERLDAAGLG